ncbi:very short patch repair endonuclease [Streptomyces thinghirensis]|nr:very short patch repair endonuclease [Streptomyces thinghirensis]
MAVFVDGCFWHGCPEHYRPATRNAEFWQEKIEGNRSRDRETNEIFRAAGWSVIRVWEHEAPETAAELVSREVRARRSGSRSSPSLVKVGRPLSRSSTASASRRSTTFLSSVLTAMTFSPGLRPAWTRRLTGS